MQDIEASTKLRYSGTMDWPAKDEFKDKIKQVLETKAEEDAKRILSEDLNHPCQRRRQEGHIGTLLSS